MNKNQKNQSMFKFEPPNIFGIDESHPCAVDLIIHGDGALTRCCKMDDISFQLEVEPKLLNWLDKNCIDVTFSVYFGIFYFKSDEDRVKFILRWL